MKKIVLIGGGTVSHIRNHLALCAPAYGSTVKGLKFIMRGQINETEYVIESYLTKMAGGGLYSTYTRNKPAELLNTNDDISKLVDYLIADPEVRVIIFNPALVDFDGQIGDVESGKYAKRLETSKGDISMKLTPTDKIIGRIRKERKDIFVVGFKTTTNATSDEQYKKGLELLKKNSLNLVLANDTVTRNNMIIVPEEARYAETVHRGHALKELVRIVLSRMTNTFTRSTVVEGPTVEWKSDLVPDNLREVVNYCIAKGAYKPVLGKTAGHFAVKINDKEILTSIRKSNYNDNLALVRVEYDGLDKVKAHGAKPSVGGMSQRIIFTEHEDAECIAHFHCKPKDHMKTLTWIDHVPSNVRLNDDELSIRPQIYNECGSTNCGINTSNGLARVDLGDGDYLKAVYLDNHGPNIVFSKNTPAQKVIDYIDRTFDLSSKTGGLIA